MVAQDLWATAKDHERRITAAEQLLRETREILERIETEVGLSPSTPPTPPN